MIRLLSFVRGFTALLAALGALVASTVHADPPDIAAAARGVVRVVLVAESGQDLGLVGHGSGFAVAPDLIVTNAHVIDPARQLDNIRIGVVPPQGDSGWFARIVAVSPKNDLALLKLTEKGSLPVLTLFTGAVADGSDVFAVGYPGNVDMAQGLGVGDIVSPTSPVKTRGNVSSGRSSKQFDTILHNAAIGSGNSGGPLLDACGRVIGANTFGTISDGSDSEFYFAVSMREIMRFLLSAKVQPRSTGVACKSMADVERAEAEREAGERAMSSEEKRAATEKQQALQIEARETAMLDVLAERENGLALAGIALVLALGAGGIAWRFAEREDRMKTKIAGAAAVLLLASSAWAWLSRPGLSDIAARADRMAGNALAPGSHGKSDRNLSGKLACTLDLSRSRVTVSDTADVDLDWTAQGCADGGTQYGLDGQGWSRIAVRGGGDAVTVSRFDPAGGTYTTDRWYPELGVLQDLRAKAAKLPSASCGGGEADARDLGRAQAELAAQLPASPNERLVYDCGPATGG